MNEPPEEIQISRKSRLIIITATLLALFISALDTLVISAAMPTVVSDLGGLHLYSWVFTAPLLTRTVSLPIFGKLADLLKLKMLYNISIIVFLVGSILAGLAQSMVQLIVFRAFQGIGAGGIFALVYIVLADISTPETRGKTLSLASFIWGLASVAGPTIGGFIVSYFSWRWIFYINIPVGVFSVWGISLYFIEIRDKKKKVAIDAAGAATLSITILALLTMFVMTGRGYAWFSPLIFILMLVTIFFGTVFYFVEQRAEDPILSLSFFKNPSFSLGNGAAFFACFSIFSLFVYSPLFIQGALGKTPMALGLAMLVLSLGWSVGAFACGHLVNRLGKKPLTIAGALFLAAGCGLCLTFSSSTSLIECMIVFTITGFGIGFVTFCSLLIVQDGLEKAHLGVATASNQFARTLGGTIGVGIAGSFLNVKLSGTFETLLNSELQQRIPQSVFSRIQESPENLFVPEVQALIDPGVLSILQEALGRGVMVIFWTSLIASLLALVFAIGLPGKNHL